MSVLSPNNGTHETKLQPHANTNLTQNSFCMLYSEINLYFTVCLYFLLQLQLYAIDSMMQTFVCSKAYVI